MFLDLVAIQKTSRTDFTEFTLPCLLLSSGTITVYDLVQPEMSSCLDFSPGCKRFIEYLVNTGVCEDKHRILNFLGVDTKKSVILLIPLMFGTSQFMLDLLENPTDDILEANFDGWLFYWLAFWLYWVASMSLSCRLTQISLSNRYVQLIGDDIIVKKWKDPEWVNVLHRSFLLRWSQSWRRFRPEVGKSTCKVFCSLAVSPKLLRYGQSRYFIRFLSLPTGSQSHFYRFTRNRKLLRSRFWSTSRFYYSRFIRYKIRYLRRFFPRRLLRQFRFVRKFKARFTVRALHTNLFFTIRQGKSYFVASTGMFEDLKRGTKRKRTLMAGWFLADRLFANVGESLKVKSIFKIDLYGRTSGRRGIWFSWRTKQWRIYQVYSKTPIAFNGTRARRKRRL